ncbi:MAG: bifunctional response regulator/alkaline phosphatase family protein [Bacteroidales bacterium]|nr:bifunctional response regulator/alkaline phosphatase family protein [Bacteroidales bacterium]
MARILWVDDEIEMLRPHIMFLEQKGYDLDAINNGADGLMLIDKYDYDLVFLDENMPGISGLDVLIEIKKINSELPVIMITKSEEESIMEEAIGSNIADYLIKPVNPNQILLAIKKNINATQIISEKNTMDYQRQFREIGMELGNNLDPQEWITIYKKLVDWEMKLEKSEDGGILDIFQTQKDEANIVFSNFVAENYIDWLHGADDKPVMSQTAFRKKVLPQLKDNTPTFLFVIDNLRYDQWKTIYPTISEYFRVVEDSIYYSILPTTTQYARNSFFSGLMPSEIEKKYPQYWTQEHEEGTKNQFEGELLGTQLKRLGLDMDYSYNKIITLDQGRKLAENTHKLFNKKLNIIVYNFVDMLSHARTEMEVIRELASDEKAYRSLTLSWFKNSPLFEIMKTIADKKGQIIITTDHGSVKVKKPVKVVGDKTTNSNLRYKFGRKIDYKPKEVFEVTNPEDVFLPKINVSTKYIFAKQNNFFLYPNNYNYYYKYYNDTFQHGGISLEEVLIPLITLSAK